MSKPLSREVFDDDMLTLLEQGRAVAVLHGTRVMLTAPKNLKPHHHVLSVEEAARRLNLKHLPPRKGFLARIFGKK
jgi:hypothetical protein